jgi:hypothetical protein
MICILYKEGLCLEKNALDAQRHAVMILKCGAKDNHVRHDEAGFGGVFDCLNQ